MLDRAKKILNLSSAVQATFTASEWREIAVMTGAEEWIDRHPRLLRSLLWGDNDYKGNVIEAVSHILQLDPANLRQLVKYPPIESWLREIEPGFLEETRSEIEGTQVPDVVPQASTDAGLAALADAQALLRERGPTSAVDRVHTGVHAFLKAACDAAGIENPPSATPNQLLKLLLEHHPALGDLGPRGQEIKKMVRSSAAILDSLGTLRNRSSLAHPSEELLDRDEALFTINLARSLLHFLDAKLSKPSK